MLDRPSPAAMPPCESPAIEAERPNTEQVNLPRSIMAAQTLRLQIATMLKTEENSGELSPDDLQALQDTFTGETDLDAEVRKAVLLIFDDEILITGLKAHIAQMTERKRRLEKRIETTRGLIEQAMIIGQWPKLPLDIATVTCGDATPRVVVDEESEIPSQFFKRLDPVLAKGDLNKPVMERHKAIAKAKLIKDEAARAKRLAQIDEDMPPIPGVHVEEGGVTLTIRRT